jgi:hypothetical protein
MIEEEEVAEGKTAIEDITDKAIDHAEENPVPTIAIGAGFVVLVFSAIACCIYKRNKKRIIIQVGDADELSNENVGTESPQAPNGEHDSSVQLESVGDDDQSKNLAVSKSNKKSNHDESLAGVDISSERSGMEAREGGERMELGKRYSVLPPIKHKGAATTQKYPSMLNYENPFKSANKVGTSPGSPSPKK